jgi:methionyl-tRNA formyltransferase
MFDTVILLSSALERAIFMTVLSEHNPFLTIIPVETLADLNALEPDTLATARLIAFVTGVIVPADVLDRLGFGAYNFHPGPPGYPGFAPAHFALYQRAAEFGATAHVMAARVDEGPIVGVEMFSIPHGTSVIGLEGMAYARLAYLFWSLAARLATCGKPLAQLPLSWSGKKTTRRDVAAICDGVADIPKDELDRPSNCSAGTISGLRRPSICAASSPAPHSRRSASERPESQSQRPVNIATPIPASWAIMKAGTPEGAMPANVSESDRAIVTAGLANDVEAVNQ